MYQMYPMYPKNVPSIFFKIILRIIKNPAAAGLKFSNVWKCDANF